VPGLTVNQSTVGSIPTAPTDGEHPRKQSSATSAHSGQSQ